jgi:hypothetical protein
MSEQIEWLRQYAGQARAVGCWMNLSPERADAIADELERMEDDATLLDWGDRTGHHDIRYNSLRDELRAEITAEAARTQGERT